MSDQPAMSEAEIETTAWDLEAKMMEIRRDPRAALTNELAKIRSTMLAEYKAYFAKKEADLDAHYAKKEADLDAAFAARLAKIEARFDATMADLTPELRACLVD